MGCLSIGLTLIPKALGDATCLLLYPTADHDVFFFITGEIMMVLSIFALGEIMMFSIISRAISAGEWAL